MTAGYCLRTHPIDNLYYKLFISTASLNRCKLAHNTGLYITALYYFIFRTHCTIHGMG